MMEDGERIRRSRFRNRLFRWFETNGRSLSWRSVPEKTGGDRPDPYRVWLSEIMLQQTTTATVEGFFNRFLTRFPTIESLGSAELNEVLRYWEGLGYYRRAHHLHAAARRIMDEFDGRFPERIEDVLTLPGIGRYTAGAILSIAFDQRQPILEANTIRLYSRLIGSKEDPRSASGAAQLWSFAESLLPKKRSGVLNQSLMDLGSLVCLPKSPRCSECPVVDDCQAAQTGTQNEIPVIARKIEKESRTEVALLIRKDQKKRSDQFLLLRYPSGGRWTGLWDFPRFLQEWDREPSMDPLLRHSLIRLLLNGKRELVRTVPWIGPVRKMIRHSVTRFRIQLLFCETSYEKNMLLAPYSPNDLTNEKIDSNRVSLASGDYPLDSLEFDWFTISEAESLAMTSTGRRLIELMKRSK